MFTHLALAQKVQDARRGKAKDGGLVGKSKWRKMEVGRDNWGVGRGNWEIGRGNWEGRAGACC